ncbi:helix-turn-helix domain-containing protein [uncultured Nostoc sp.]
MLHKVLQVRLYPSQEQQIQLAQAFGCAFTLYQNLLNMRA